MSQDHDSFRGWGPERGAQRTDYRGQRRLGGDQGGLCRGEERSHHVPSIARKPCELPTSEAGTKLKAELKELMDFEDGL